MATFLNHYSFLLLFALIGLVLAFILLRDGVEARDLLALGALALGFVFSFVSFAPGGHTVSDVDEFEAALADARPLLLEIQSPYCLGCAAAKPIVDGIEADNPDLRVLRVNVQDPVGAQLADRYRSRVTPTFLLFDGSGTEQLRSYGAIDPAEVDRLLEK